MLSSEPAQTKAIRKIRHRDKDCVGVLISWNPEIIRPVEGLPDQPYSSAYNGWTISYKRTRTETFPDYYILNKIEYSYFLPEQTKTRTISEPTTKDDRTGISSPVEESAVVASISEKLKLELPHKITLHCRLMLKWSIRLLGF